MKQRSTLVNLIEPAGVIVGYLSEPMTNLKTLAEGGSALIKGDFGGTGEALSTLVERGYNPKGVGGALYNSAQAIQAVSGALVGGLEVAILGLQAAKRTPRPLAQSVPARRGGNLNERWNC